MIVLFYMQRGRNTIVRHEPCQVGNQAALSGMTMRYLQFSLHIKQYGRIACPFLKGFFSAVWEVLLWHIWRCTENIAQKPFRKL